MTEYRNPQDDPGAQKRLMLAFFLVFVAIAVMQFFLPKPQPQPPKTPERQQAQATPSETAAATPTASNTPSARSAAARANKAPVPNKVPVKEASQETESVLENDYYRITFTNRGGLVKSWILKKYKDEKGRPLDLVNSAAAPTLGYPLSLFTYDKDLQKRLNESLYVASGTGVQPSSVTFEYSDGDLMVRKVFRSDKMYTIGAETEVSSGGRRVNAYQQWPSGLGDQGTPGSYAATRLDWNQNGNIERKNPTSGNFITGKKWVAGGQTLNGPFDWAATVGQYFAVASMPDSQQGTALVTLNSPVEIPHNPANPNDATKDKVSVLGFALGNENGVTLSRIFAGPKAIDVLESTQAKPNGPDLRGILDFGFFGFIAKPLFLWLKWTYEHWIHNWGWAIAFLTLVITMALLPLRISTLKSSLKMQKIQPQIKSINEKYKRYSITDPRRQEMQKEMSELYKREGVNPVGGCFPMLLQMPFLFAFYSMLGNTIELRQASWLWVHDLSAPDPTHILPILIIITMFLSQKSMPQAGMDPAQQKMMNVMGPLMIGILSWGVAAGLCVYWALSQVLGYVQQMFINRTQAAQQVRKSLERRATRKK